MIVREVYEPKWVNYDYISYGVNSFRIRGLHMQTIELLKNLIFNLFLIFSLLECFEIFNINKLLLRIQNVGGTSITRY